MHLHHADCRALLRSTQLGALSALLHCWETQYGAGQNVRKEKFWGAVKVKDSDRGRLIQLQAIENNTLGCLFKDSCRPQ